MTTKLEDHLAHFGRKGMKWGIRRSYSGTTAMSKAEWDSNSQRSKSAEKFLASDKHPKDSDTPIDPQDEVHHHGWTGTGHLHADYASHRTVDDGKIVFYRKFDTGEKLYHVSKDGTGNDIVLDENGSPVKSHEDLKAYKDEFAVHSTDVGKFLAHFGRKGMKWGIRRSKAQLSGTVSESSSKSPDAIRAHETLVKIRTASSVTAVSDADLQHLTNRLNLEKRFSEVDPSTFDKGHAKLQKALKVGGTANDVLKFANSPAGNLMADMLGLSGHGKHARPIVGSKEEKIQKAARKAAKAAKKAKL